MTAAHREALARYFRRRGTPAFTTESYTRQGMLDALREARRHRSGDAHVRFLGQAAATFVRDLTEVVDLPPADIATVLLAAGGAVGVFAELHGFNGTDIAGLLQYAADDLDRAAKAGEQP
ncbi:hypothetical protein [Streptomyces sp. NPDC001914]|uniref:hypothetical protein n=1 Tax=Streptomyces sp. NPDC001914 TaxID=3364623 RepID=UPI0036A39F78